MWQRMRHRHRANALLRLQATSHPAALNAPDLLCPIAEAGLPFLLYTFAERIASAIFASTQHMLCQNRRRHTADAAGDRGVRFYDLSCILRTDVTRYGTVRRFVDPNVDDRLFTVQKGPVDKTCLSERGDQDVGVLRNFVDLRSL